MKHVAIVLMMIMLIFVVVPNNAIASTIMEEAERWVSIWSGGYWYNWHLVQQIGFQYNTLPMGIELTENYNCGHFQNHPLHPLFVLAGDLDIYEGSTRIRNWRTWELEPYLRYIPGGYNGYGGKIVENTYLHLLQASYYSTAFVAASYEAQGRSWTLRYDF